MYKDIEKQLNKITGNLKTVLTQSKAIDEHGKAIDIKKFNQILDEMIAQCNEVLATTEKDGVTVDRYGANIAYTRINRLEDMKKHRAITPELVWAAQEEIADKRSVSEKKRKTAAFDFGISKLAKKIQSKFKPSISSEKNR